MVGQVPRREKLLKATGRGEPADVVYADMAQFVELAAPIVDTVHQYFVDNGLNDTWKA